MSTRRLVKTFCDLVSTGSETGHERAFCLELEKALTEAGFEVERDEEAGKKCGSDGFNIYGYLPGEGESFVEQGWKFEIVDLDGRRIDKLLVSEV